MSQVPLEDSPAVNAAAHEAAGGKVVYLTERGERLAAIVPAAFAAVLEGMPPRQAAAFLEHVADLAAALDALSEPGDDIPADQVWAELGLT